MVGNRGETKETMEQTFQLARRLGSDTAQFYPLLPFPGTEAYAWAKATTISGADMPIMSRRTAS